MGTFPRVSLTDTKMDDVYLTGGGGAIYYRFGQL